MEKDESEGSLWCRLARGGGLGTLVLLAAALPVFGQTRPLLTEEATTAAAGTFVLEAGLDQSHAEPNFITDRPRDRWDLPVLRLVYSPAGNVEVDLEWVGRVIARNDPDFGTVSDWGDVTLRAKVRFGAAPPGRPVWGARFGVSLPETNIEQGLGPNVLRMFAQLLWTRPIGRASLHANAGLVIHDDVLLPDQPVRTLGQEDFFGYGLALVGPVSPRVSLMAEIAGRAGSGARGADQRGEVRAGIRFASKVATWDAAIRRGFTHVDGTWGFTAGATWTLRRGR